VLGRFGVVVACDYEKMEFLGVGENAVWSQLDGKLIKYPR
jgi:hypothetical protein